MPRTARIKDNYGVYHITQQGCEHRNLFNNDYDKNKFLSILIASKDKNDFKLYGYCLANSNVYHLILNSNGADISKIMKEINIGYAMYVESSIPIFKDRYKSDLIKDKEDLLALLKEMHENGKKVDSNYNSYCFYDEDGLQTTFLLDIDDIELLSSDCSSINTECKNCINTLDEAKTKLVDIANSKGLSTEELLKDKSQRNEFIKNFRRNSTLSLKELGVVFGNLSESTICKILNN